MFIFDREIFVSASGCIFIVSVPTSTNIMAHLSLSKRPLSLLFSSVVCLAAPKQISLAAPEKDLFSASSPLLCPCRRRLSSLDAELPSLLRADISDGGSDAGEDSLVLEELGSEEKLVEKSRPSSPLNLSCSTTCSLADQLRAISERHLWDPNTPFNSIVANSAHLSENEDDEHKQKEHPLDSGALVHQLKRIELKWREAIRTKEKDAREERRERRLNIWKNSFAEAADVPSQNESPKKKTCRSRAIRNRPLRLDSVSTNPSEESIQVTKPPLLSVSSAASTREPFSPAASRLYDVLSGMLPPPGLEPPSALHLPGACLTEAICREMLAENWSDDWAGEPFLEEANRSLEEHRSMIGGSRRVWRSKQARQSDMKEPLSN